ncbi:hypothetical protein ACFWTE_05235 [Nocardiopsis sp. NPDC058631]|uniref:TPR repeat region-containing protein n=1 Tax=Nocardiopsis sp. NPDC058631 TaxID=3346566 RepID=UPI003655729B
MNFSPEECDVDTGTLDSVADDMLNLVSRITGKSGDLESLFNDSAKEFSDLVASDILSTATENQTAWMDALAACFHVWGVVTKWRGEVDRYEQNIDGLREEWESAVGNNFGYDAPDNYAIVEAQRWKAEELNGRAETYWTTLEGQSEDNSSNLAGGPSVSSLRELIDAGVLGFAAYNSTRQIMYYPTTEGNGEEHAEELLEYIEGGKEPDAHYYHLLAQLAAINALSLDGQRNGDKLRPDQIDYLEDFYTALEDQSEDGTVTSVVNAVQQGDLPDSNQDELMEALGGGILALSDGSLGGGYDRLPESVRMLVEGPSDYWEPEYTGRDYHQDTEGNLNNNWARHAGLLADLLQSAPSLEGQPMQGGTGFSAHLTVTVSEALGLHYNNDASHDEALQSLLDVSTRNPEANAVLFTGDTTNDRPYSHPNFGDIELGDVLQNLYQHDWDDDGEAVGQMTDWISEYANSDDPDQRELAGESTADLIEAIAGDNELYLELIGVEMEEDEGKFVVTNNDDPKVSFTELNPGIAESFFEVFHTYIEDFGGETDGVYEYRPGERDLNLPLEARTRFMQYIASDDDSAVRMIASVEGQQMSNLSFDNLNSDSKFTAGAENGTLQGLLDSALQNEAMNRTANENEAAESTAERQRKSAMLVTDIALGVAKIPASTHPASAIGAEILAATIKDGIQTQVNEDFQAEIGDFAEARGDSYTPEDDVRRNASLYLLSQLVDSEQSNLELSDIDEIAITESSDGTRRVASDIHEIYSRSLSTMDGRIDSDLRENEIILNQEEMRDSPGATPETITAYDFVTTYTRSHREQYEEITDNYRSRTPQEIAEMIGQ